MTLPSQRSPSHYLRSVFLTRSTGSGLVHGMARDCGDFAEFQRAWEPARERFGESDFRAISPNPSSSFSGSGPRMETCLVHQHVAELPGITGVEGLWKQLAAADERRPVGVAPDHWTEIRPLQVEAATEIHFIRLDDAALGI